METHRLEQGKASQATVRRKVVIKNQDTGVHQRVMQTRFDHSLLTHNPCMWQSQYLPCEAINSPIGNPNLGRRNA